MNAVAVGNLNISDLSQLLGYVIDLPVLYAPGRPSFFTPHPDNPMGHIIGLITYCMWGIDDISSSRSPDYSTWFWFARRSAQ